jgi:hypothetical protein
MTSHYMIWEVSWDGIWTLIWAPTILWSWSWSLGAVYTMDHEVVPRPSKQCDWTLKLSRDDMGLHQGKNGRVTTEVEVLKM